MASPSIPPLRYQKGGNGSSPQKGPMALNRPLSEISPMAVRRNSPSFPQSKGSPLKQESSPATSSPFGGSNVHSPHLFWQQRDAASPSRENQNPNDATSTKKRSSLENLKRASRVKNSSMFAKEQQNHYDPARPNILDGRPLGGTLQGYAVNGRASQMFNQDEDEEGASKPSATSYNVAPLSPSKMNISPAKSSLSKKTGAKLRSSGFDPESSIWEDEVDEERKLPEGRGLHRHAKSVTFDQAPPQINEYEMTTPAPSSVASGSREGSYDSYNDDEEDLSFERGSSVDHDDSFDASLEDTDKTPVVLPEDWRFMSPQTANKTLAAHEEDVFEDDLGSPAPSAEPGRTSARAHQISVNSVDSNGQSRPLPPLPPTASGTGLSNQSRSSLSGTIERMSSGQRALPSPPPAASLSKSDLRRMSRESLSLEDRLRLMMINENQKQQKDETNSPRNRQAKNSNDLQAARIRLSAQFNEDSILSTGTASLSDPQTHLDRSSILRQLRGAQLEDDGDDMEGDHDSHYDPDVPIPSMEDPTQHDVDDIVVKEEAVDDNDLYAIPDMYARLSDATSEAATERSHQELGMSDSAIENNACEGNDTPRAQSPAATTKKHYAHERMSLPEFEDFGENSSFNLDMSEYITPPSEKPQIDKPLPETPIQLPDLQAVRDNIQRPQTPEEALEPPKLSFSGDESSADPGTPNSVIRHEMSSSPDLEVADGDGNAHEPIFERRFSQMAAMIEAGSEPSEKDDVHETQKAMDQPPPDTEVTEKRVSSLVQLEIANSNKEDDLGLLGLEQEFDRVVEAQKVAFELSLQRLYFPFNGRFPSGESPAPGPTNLSPSDRDDFNPIEQSGVRATSQIMKNSSLFPPPLFEGLANQNHYRQRGYLMRQNTKVVVASGRAPQETVEVSNEDSVAETVAETALPQPSVEPNAVRPSSRKASQPTWTAEPWNGKSRRRSIRVGGEKATARRKAAEGPMPPLPGQQSVVQDNLAAVAKDEIAEEEAEELEDGVERGRLFVKVAAVKDLQLPFPQNERTQFALTLDNGIHCVTTAWLDLAQSAPIGQEFELVVLNDLEFQLTLQMKLEQPKAERAPSPSKIPTSPKKQGAFGRLFGSPKKKKESDLRASAEARRPVTPPSAYELVQGLVAKDGSFARAYVSLSEHEKQAYGRPYLVDIKCFNEWAMEEVSAGSSRSKKAAHLQHRPPYEIGKLELQLLYVPKPKGAKDEDMPKSMNSAIRTLREAEDKMRQQASVKEFEGYLSQQGGDCPYWRRRFFKLVGSKLTAYHEATLQPRATINLNKANKLIDDKSSLTQKETSTKGGGRRKSAFADDEEGYMFVEEGFRIRFGNGEVIDFYADSAASKDEWMQVLCQVVGKNVSGSASSIKGWAEMVLKKEKVLKAKAQVETSMKKANRELQQHEQTAAHIPQQAVLGHTSSIPIPTPAIPHAARQSAHARTESYQGQSGTKSQATSPVKSKVTPAERRAKARSMAM